MFHSVMNLFELEIELCAIACAMRLYEPVARISRAVSRIRSRDRYGPNRRCCALWRPDFRHSEILPPPTRWIARAVGDLQQAPTGWFSCGSRSCGGSARPAIWIVSCITQSLTSWIHSLLCLVADDQVHVAETASHRARRASSLGADGCGVSPRHVRRRMSTRAGTGASDTALTVTLYRPNCNAQYL